MEMYVRLSWGIATKYCRSSKNKREEKGGYSYGSEITVKSA